MPWSSLARGLCLAALLIAVAACQHRPPAVEPCDILVDLNPSPATNSFIVANDRTFAQEVAMSKGRYSVYKCGG